MSERFDATFPPIPDSGEVKLDGTTSLEIYRTARLALAFPGEVKGRGERLERMLRYFVFLTILNVHFLPPFNPFLGTL